MTLEVKPINLEEVVEVPPTVQQVDLSEVEVISLEELSNG